VGLWRSDFAPTDPLLDNPAVISDMAFESEDLSSAHASENRQPDNESIANVLPTCNACYVPAAKALLTS
jgi:hypothetical protein